MVTNNIADPERVCSECYGVDILYLQDPADARSSKTLLTMFCSCVNNGTCVTLTEEEQKDIETK